MRISDVLRSKGSNVVTVDPDCTVLDVVRTLVDHNIGAVVVMEDDRPVGIVSERDILKLTARVPDQLAGVRARTLMTIDLVTSTLDDDLDRVMHLMTNHRVRHLPILSDGRLVGIVSIGDVVNKVRSEVEETNRHLMSYISGNG
jgi:CBS domain-containing protein